MKRPPGLWILLSAGVLWLTFQDAYGIRATALIFSKSVTSTTETPAAVEGNPDNKEVTNNTDTLSNNVTATANSTDPVLTGIPQIDYIFDPNLPKELNGYNLTEYPFYERVPEEIDFKCDGLHDGFYASIPHKCQVYHHCLFGTRYDFLCANYTAFDQKTFICHFVSEVDCINSKKFWHRNDALYKAQSTTTTGSPLRAAIYTPPPETVDPLTPALPVARRPAGGGRKPHRPLQPRRPPVVYYDDYYDDEYYDNQPRGRPRKRRPRPRPIYDDEYEDYDYRYQSRRGGGGGRRQKPYKNQRWNDRRKPEYDEDDEEINERAEKEDTVAIYKHRVGDDRRQRPAIDDEYDDRIQDRKRPNSNRRQPVNDNSSRKPPRKGNRRPVNYDYDEDQPSPNENRNNDDNQKKRNKTTKDENLDQRPIVKPATGTIYDRPRVAPRINLPVPKNAADKFAYKPINGGRGTASGAPLPTEEIQYEDEEYEETLPKHTKSRKPQNGDKNDKIESEETKVHSTSKSRNRPAEEEVSTIRNVGKPTINPPTRNKFRPTATSKRKPVNEEYYDEEYADEEKVVEERRPLAKIEKKTTTTPSTTTTEESRKETIMRVIKRPFLPSRGGNPYGARGLQPVGVKAVDRNKNTNIEQNTTKQESDTKPIKEIQRSEEDIAKPIFKPSPVILKTPLRSKYNPPVVEPDELIDPESSRQQTYKTKDYSIPRSSPVLKPIEKSPIDLNEYDVTLNDALNPTLPNLPLRSFPTGLGTSVNDYSYNSYQRQPYVVEPVINPTNQNFVFPSKVVKPQTRYESQPQGQYSRLNSGSRQQTQAIYTSY